MRRGGRLSLGLALLLLSLASQSFTRSSTLSFSPSAALLVNHRIPFPTDWKVSRRPARLSASLFPSTQSSWTIFSCNHELCQLPLRLLYRLDILIALVLGSYTLLHVLTCTWLCSSNRRAASEVSAFFVSSLSTHRRPPSPPRKDAQTTPKSPHR